jgi:hypothetical protein
MDPHDDACYGGPAARAWQLLPNGADDAGAWPGPLTGRTWSR